MFFALGQAHSPARGLYELHIGWGLHRAHDFAMGTRNLKKRKKEKREKRKKEEKRERERKGKRKKE